jgi:ParB family chromosome partitioning protein
MLKKVKLRDVKPNPFQMRKERDAETIKSLAQEIKEVGLWPGALRGRERNGHVELCFGHRRLEAVRLLGWKEIEIDTVDLSDEQMSLQALIENLQREGLNDVEKGEAIETQIKLQEQSGILSRDKIYDSLTSLLGYSREKLLQFRRIAGFTEEIKEEIRARKITGRTAEKASRIGGEEFVKVAANEKLPERTVEEIGHNLGNIKDETIKKKVREEIKKGKITDPDEVVKRARREEGRKKNKESLPPDLIVVINNWTLQINQWINQLDQVTPYKDYIDTQPKIAEKWRIAVGKLIARLQDFL